MIQVQLLSSKMWHKQLLFIMFSSEVFLSPFKAQYYLMHYEKIGVRRRRFSYLHFVIFSLPCKYILIKKFLEVDLCSYILCAHQP